MKTVQCSSCGQSASGNFCSHCGAPLASPDGKRDASAQHAAVPPAPTPRAKWNARKLAPWAALVLAAGVLGAWVSTLPRSGDAVRPTAVRFSESTAPAVAPEAGGPPDLSTMTPREAADRLFNRVMRASENGDTEEARRFAPMAIQAYERVGELDDDAYFHVALLQMTAGDMKAARKQLHQLQQSAPNHLLGFMLEQKFATRSGDQAGVERAYRRFLAAYDQEMAMGRPEYLDHEASIKRFRDTAQASLAGKK